MESVHSTVMQQQHWLQVPQSEVSLISLSAGFSALTYDGTMNTQRTCRKLFHFCKHLDLLMNLGIFLIGDIKIKTVYYTVQTTYCKTYFVIHIIGTLPFLNWTTLVNLVHKDKVKLYCKLSHSNYDGQVWFLFISLLATLNSTTKSKSISLL